MAVLGYVLCKCTGSGNFAFAFTDFTYEFRKDRNAFRKLPNVSISRKIRVPEWKLSIGNKTRVVSMDAHEKSKYLTLNSSKQKRVPVFVMMPLDPFGIDTYGTLRIKKMKALSVSLKALKMVGVHGIAVEVWWGIAERTSPLAYDWSLYEELFKLVSGAGLKLHVSFCFHSNVRLSSQQKGSVGLPLWIQKIGAANKDIYYQDRNGFPSDDCLTLGVDEVPLFGGRTALQCYENFIFNFLDKFDSLIGSVIEEIGIGLGPAGELRYPSHPNADGRWTFPGIGEFQCYDKYMMEDLKIAADREGKPEWGENGPQSTGGYNSSPSGIPFFEHGPKSFLSDYGHFFLDWYSSKLIHHADAVLGKAAEMLKKYQQDDSTSVLLVAKIGIIYWWYQTLSHAAELTAGYYNTAVRDGYDPLASVLFRHGAALHISCLEMMDSETPPEYNCSPERLLQQAVLQQQFGVDYFESLAEGIRSFTYFRMGADLFHPDNFNNFLFFMRGMGADC